MIRFIEQAIISRLSDGLGEMVTTVESYGGQFDDEGLAQVVNQFPAVWVLFAGIKDTVPHDTRRSKYRVEGVFTVLVGDRASGSEADSRIGGGHRHDVGSYRLLRAVRLLLGNQSLGLPIDRLQPKAAKSLFNRQLEADALSVFALEFETHWYENALPDGEWPQMPMKPVLDAGGNPQGDPATGGTQYRPDTDHPDAVFAEYVGRIDPPYADLTGINLNLHRNNRDPAAIRATVAAQSKDKP